MRKIYAKDWNIRPLDERMNTYYLRRLLDSCREEGNAEIVFEQGTYHFYPDYAEEKLLYISNHDEDTIKRIAFDLTGMRSVRLTGNGAVFLFHTDILPFYAHECSNLAVSGIVMDYARTAYSEGTIRRAERDVMEVEIDKKEYPYFILHNRIYFKGENFCNELVCGCLEMDGDRLAPVYQGHDIGFNRPYEGSYCAQFREIEENVVEIRLTDPKQSFLETSRAGNRMIFRHHLRTHPAFYITDSSGIVLEDIVIYHCTGMAVISQFSEDIEINRFRIVRHPQKDRVFTATADGFHFVYCRGEIQIKNCELENQLDDPVNIHGIYGRIHQVLGEREALVELVEGMQKGVRLGRPGDRFAVLDNETMLVKQEMVLEEIEVLNKDFMRMKFDGPAQGWECGYVVENLDYVPNVLIEDCIFRNNRARGLLLTSAGSVTVRRNLFENAGAAVLIEGDSNYWFESGAVNTVRVDNNRFINCAYVSDWGSAPIQVSPSARKLEPGRYYHHCLEIVGNEFQCFDDRLIKARNIEKIVLKDNVIRRTQSFPPLPGERIVTEHVGEVIEENNKETV